VELVLMRGKVINTIENKRTIMTENRFPSLGNRMKEYEAVPQNNLTRRMPIIIRLDGKSFHKYTKGMTKPFDIDLQMNMWRSTARLCKEVQNTVLAYCQSDEVSLLVIDYNTLNTMPWFANEVQKLCSISASAMTSFFNDPATRGNLPYGATFDSRCFNLPREEVTNYFHWRQVDAIRNSVQSVAQYYFSPKELYKKNVAQMKQMLFEVMNFDYDKEIDTSFQRGTCVITSKYHSQLGNHSHKLIVPATKSNWTVDCNIPVFKEDRNYIENLLYNDYDIKQDPKTYLY